jgi:dTMP kinase
MQHQGKFITFEGIEGAGKSTALNFIQEYLQQHKIDTIVTREPGGTEIAEKIRQVVLAHYTEEMASDTELLLFFAARAQHIAKVIKPALQAGKIVLCDRFTDASFAYQCGGRGIDAQRVAALEAWVHADLQPDLTILMDVSIEIGIQRATKRGELDRIEIEKQQFFTRVKEHYALRAQKYSQRFRMIDASIPLNAMQKVLQDLIDKEVLRKYDE